MADSLETKNSPAAEKREMELTLEKDAAAFVEEIERIEAAVNAAKKKGERPPVPFDRVLLLKEAPLALQVIGDDAVSGKSAGGNPIYISTHTFKNIIKDIHLTFDTLKKFPQAMADPIMIFDSADPKAKANGDIVFMLDLKDKNGSTVVAAVALESGDTRHGLRNVVKSAYAKDTDKNQENKIKPDDDWFKRQTEKGNVRYCNREKLERWQLVSRVHFPFEKLHNAHGNKIYHYEDVVKFQTQNKELERWQLAAGVQFSGGKLRNALEKTFLTPDSLVKLHDDWQQMEGEYKGFLKAQEERLPGLEETCRQNDQIIKGLPEDIELRDNFVTKAPFVNVNGHVYNERRERAFIKEVLQPAARKSLKTRQPQAVGQYRGFSVLVEGFGRGRGARFSIQGSGGLYAPPELRYEGQDSFKFIDFTKCLDNCLARFEARLEEAREKGPFLARELEEAKTGQGFPQMEMLEALRSDNRQALIELRLSQKDPTYKSTWKPKSWALAKQQIKEQAKAAAPGKETERKTSNQKFVVFGR